MKSAKLSFKYKANAMIKSSPQSMQDFLDEDSQKSITENHLQMQNVATANLLNLDKISTQTKDIVRIHVHIRQDLADKIFETVFQRKKNKSTIRKEASQRAIVEEALEIFFKKNIG